MTGGSSMLKRVVSLMVAATLAVPNLIAAPITVLAEASPAGGTVPLKTWYTKPASNWESEAIPIGNGHMGAMIFGGIEKDQILINEKTLWSGGPGADPAYNGGHKDTAEEKHAILQEVRTELQNLMTEHSKGRAPYKDETGKVIARNYNVPNSVNNKINGSSTTKGLIGTKKSFGSFQELGSIWLEDLNAARPTITRIYTAQDHKTSANENVQKLFDNNPSTKYFADGHAGSNEYVIEWDYNKPMPTRSYSITTGNDSQGRDPKDWILTASNDGQNFITVDSVSGFQNAGRTQTRTFDLDVPGSYKYFKFIVKALNDTNQALQMSELTVLFDESAISPEQKISDYRRGLDLDTGTANMSYLQGGAEIKREYLMNYPDNVMAVRLSSNGKGKISQFISVTSAQSRKTVSSAGDTITMTGWPNDHNKAGAATDFSGTLHFAQQIKVIPTGGTLVAKDNGIQVEKADSIVILMAAGTNYQQSMDDKFNYFTGKDPLPTVSARLAAAAEKGYDQLQERHLQDYKSLFDRVKLNLMNTTLPSKPTDQLVANYARTNTPMEDRYLEQLYYQFGRYLLISSSRAGSLPANLQGVWAMGTNPPWDSDYHANINLQMNYWLAEQTNLSETNIPLLEFIKSLVPRGEISAKHGYVTPAGGPVRGWTTHHEINIWGNTAPATSSAFFSPEDGAWLAQHIWERYQFTLDKSFLKDNYDILLGAALFWVDTLWEDTRDGTLVANPSYSPEHGPYSLGATEVQSVVWGIFEEVIRASEVLGIKSSELEEIKHAQSRLAGPQIGLGGQFMEWKDEVAMDITGDNGHRHTNHLYALHPGAQIVAGRSEQDDKYVDAMKVTLNTRGDGATGWSKAWKLNFWARLHDGDRAQKLLKELLYESTLSNLFDTHPPFQIDGNFGGTAGVTEMLLQSQGGAINLLPALPSKWHTGSISGLKARGNVEVDMAWEKSHLMTAVLKAGATGPITVKGTNMSTANVQAGGKSIPFQVVNPDTIIIEAQQGTDYTISNIQETAVEHNPYEVIKATDADLLNGNITKSGTALQDASAGDYAVYKNVKFGDAGAKRVVIQASSKKSGFEPLAQIELRLDKPDGQLIASTTVDNTGDLAVYRSLSASLLTEVSGTHDLYVIFTSPSQLKALQFFTNADIGSATALQLLGRTLVSLPASGGMEVPYLASITYSDGLTQISGNLVKWSLSGSYSGVKLSDDGILSIREGVGTQDIVIHATSTENPQLTKQLPVRLVTGEIQSFKIKGSTRNDQSGGSNPSGQMQFGTDWVEFVSANGWLKFNSIDLKDGIQRAVIGYASPNASKREIQIRVAEPGVGDVNSAKTVATLNTSAATGGWMSLSEVDTSTVMEAAGKKDVYLFWPQGDFNLSYVVLDLLQANGGSTVYHDVKFDVTPADAAVVVQDSEAYKYSAGSDGRTFKLPAGREYIYTVSKPGFTAQSKAFAADASPIITVTLEVAPAPLLEGIEWKNGTIEGTTRAVKLPAIEPGHALKYVIGEAGEISQPVVGSPAAAYASALQLDENIAVEPGDHLYIVLVDVEGNIMKWVGVEVAEGDIAVAAPLLGSFSWSPGNAPGTTQAAEIPAIADGHKLMYVVAGAGSVPRPLTGADASSYANLITAGSIIAVSRDENIYIAEIDLQGSIVGWAEIVIDEKDVAVAAPGFAENINIIGGSVDGTVQVAQLPIIAEGHEIRYIVAEAGQFTRPVVGAEAAAYTDLLVAGSDIPVTAGQYIFIAEVDKNGKIVKWAAIEAETGVIAVDAPILEGLSWKGGSVAGTTRAAQLPTLEDGHVLQYIVAQSGTILRPLVGADGKLYTEKLLQDGNIAISSGQSIFIADLDKAGRITRWVEVKPSAVQISVAAPELTGLEWKAGSRSWTTRAAALPPITEGHTLRYIAGTAGTHERPIVGTDATAAGYTEVLAANEDIAIRSGQHLYVAEVDNSGSMVKWADVAVQDIHISIPSTNPGNETENPGSSNGTKEGTSPSGTETGHDASVTVTVNGLSQEHAATGKITYSDGKKVTTVTLDSAKLLAKLAEDQSGTRHTVNIQVTNNSHKLISKLNAKLMKQLAAGKATLQLSSEDAYYKLPADRINVDAIVKQFENVDLEKINISIEVSRMPASELTPMLSGSAGVGLAAPGVVFTVKAVYGDREITLNQFDAYVELGIAIEQAPKRVATGVLVREDGSLAQVPTRITEVDGTAYAVLSSFTNGVFTVIMGKNTFYDVRDHWAQEAIESLASRRVLNGNSQGNYVPGAAITRAELTTILVKALGLEQAGGSKQQFSDVAANSWYSEAVSIGAQYGLVQGQSDGTFMPDREMTREEAMVILSKAMSLAGMDIAVDDQLQTKLLDSYADAGQLGTWSREAAAQVIRAEIMIGNDGSLSPKRHLTRAETAVMIQRLLSKAGLI